jgi:hypothetical protein
VVAVTLASGWSIGVQYKFYLMGLLPSIYVLYKGPLVFVFGSGFLCNALNSYLIKYVVSKLCLRYHG